MAFSNRPGTSPTRPRFGRSGPPSWLVFLLGVAFVMGMFYLWQGVSNFMQTEGRGILESRTLQAEVNTATAVRITFEAESVLITPLPTGTAIPECTEFVVTVDRANIRAEPRLDATWLQTALQGESLCVLGEENDWYLLDLNPNTRRIDSGYVRNDLVEARNPTPTPSRTFTPAPTVTNLPTSTPTISPTPRPTNTLDPDATDTRTPTPSSTPTSPVISA